MIDLSALGNAAEIWNEWRFELWKNGSAEGLYRRVTLIKSGFLGEVARYYADDYIVWKYIDGDPVRIAREARSEPDLMLQRYLFLQTEGPSSKKKKSLIFGFRGFLEIYRYTLGDAPEKDIEDIAHLSNRAQVTVKGGLTLEQV